MQKVLTLRITGLTLAGLVLAAASFSATAQFIASSPGADLEPVGVAEKLVSLTQASNHILWVSTTGTVSNITVRGWPVDDGEVELGGGMTITRPDGGKAGVIDFDEKPMTVAFDLEN
jgi:hypothetical protein